MTTAENNDYAPGTVGYYATHPEESHPQTATFGSLLTPADFKDYRVGHGWTVGVMQYIVKVLDGTPVAVVVDDSTGHAIVGARLIAAFNGGPSRGPRLTVEITLPDGETQRTHYWLHAVGPIIDMPGYGFLKSAKYRVMGALQDDRRKAIDLGRAAQAAAGATGAYGKVTARPTRDGQWAYLYEPQNPPPGVDAGKMWHTEVVVNP